MQKLVNNLHGALSSKVLLHAYGIEGDVVLNTQKLRSLLETERGIVTTGNPDVHFLSFERMGVLQVRTLIENALLKSFSNTHTFFIISTTFVTREAQNALLKLFEDPTPGAHFFLLIPAFENLLPTLRSRLFLIRESSFLKPDSESAQFLASSLHERLTMVSGYINEKDKNGTMHFLNNLETCLHKVLIEDKMQNTNIVQALHDIEIVRGYINDRAPSLKMLLEYVALSLPQLSEK